MESPATGRQIDANRSPLPAFNNNSNSAINCIHTLLSLSLSLFPIWKLLSFLQFPCLPPSLSEQWKTKKFYFVFCLNFLFRLTSKVKTLPIYWQFNSDQCQEKTLKAAMAKHDKVYQCDICSYATPKKFRLQRHVESVHDKLRNFACEHCDYRASEKSALKLHIKSLHDKIRDFACEHCEFKAAQKSHLKLHVKGVHDNVKDYACEYCDYRTLQQSDLTKHVKNIHEKIKDFICKQCNYKASQNCSLKRHVK